MNKLNDATTKNVLEGQHQQREAANGQDNEFVSNTAAGENLQKDKHKKRHEKKKNTIATPTSGISTSDPCSTSATKPSNNISHVPSIQIPLATQFSIQRSDSDGCLRMKISAIRPSNISTYTANYKSGKDQNNTNLISGTKLKNFETKSKSSENQLMNSCNNNNNLESLKAKIISKPVITESCEVRSKVNEKLDNMSATVQQTLNDSRNTAHMSAVPSSECISDATDSGCSEATNTTTANGLEKTAKRMKIKRKKCQLKVSDSKRPLKQLRTPEITKINMFSTDSEDEPLSNKIPQKIQLPQQRAPRLLLTAISSKSSSCVTTNTTIIQTNSTNASTDRIGLSSSDNELPDLVSAAIKRVVVESDEDDNISTAVLSKAKSRQLPQYQSTLLQDFMEKTQMLGQTPNTKSDNADTSKQKLSPTRADIQAHFNMNSQSDNIASGNSNNKRRRGRPKKPFKLTTVLNLNCTTDAINNKKSLTCASNINESADSGVVSTTSVSTQSTSPQPATTIASLNEMPSIHSPQKSQTHTPEKNVTNNDASTSKPKIDIALLDKRMYATERVLYPPPKNKRRQSVCASVVLEKRYGCSNLNISAGKTSKDDQQLDPAWRKIDINRKFRRPSVASAGYKSDGADDRICRPSKSTICSKILAAKSGYVSDYGSSAFHGRLSRHIRHGGHNSGYKSDASCKSRYSTKSCVSRRSRAKSCGYRSDCKESGAKSSKFRRKRRESVAQKSLGSLKDEQDILQLAGLSLGQSSEESNEYVCKPSLEKLPTTSASKKYGEINRYIATGEYFGRGSANTGIVNTFASLNSKAPRLFDTLGTLNVSHPSANKLSLVQRKNSTTSEFIPDILQLSSTSQAVRKIKSRRSSVASYCSSYYSGTSKLKRRRKRKTFRFPNPTSSKNAIIDSKLLTEVEILTNSFASRCRIQPGSLPAPIGSTSQKEKLMAEASKLQQSLVAAAAAAVATSSSSSKRETRDKRTVKKRKINENLDFAILSASAAANALTSSGGGNSKRRHKKASSSSPDDHTLPLKKRHYLLTPGDKSSEVAVAVAAKLFANNAEAWAAAAAAAKTTACTKSQQQFNAKTAKANLTPKKRHLLQQSSSAGTNEDANSVKTTSTNSSLRVTVGDPNSISGGKLLDISPHSLNSLKQNSETVNRKRSRLEGLVSKIATHQGGEDNCINKESMKQGKTNLSTSILIDSETSSCPPPGIFEPSVELEIQIPSISKLAEATTGIITKSEIDSPLLLDLNRGFVMAMGKSEGTKVVETLLNKTGGNLLLKRKRKKINRTGFPTVRRKKRKVNEQLISDITPVISKEQVEEGLKTFAAPTAQICDRVPQAGETSDTFLERNNRTPRLSVVALERLQETPNLSQGERLSNIDNSEVSTPKTRQTRIQCKRKIAKEEPLLLTPKVSQMTSQKTIPNTTEEYKKLHVPRMRRSKVINQEIKPPIKPITLPIKQVRKPAKKSVIDTKVKLPAGIDPNTNFSCKIRLKRRSSMHPTTTIPQPIPIDDLEMISTPEEVEEQSSAKDCNIDHLEQDILPLTETQIGLILIDTEASDTSDEKSSINSLVIKKARLVRKTYLPAGLFSDYFKVPQLLTKKPINRKDAEKKETTNIIPLEAAESNADLEVHKSLLPPPPYCERYFRRTLIDFELPHDIWWAYKNCKLPSRIMVPSWNYRKIRTNIYAESVRPPNMAANDHPMCNCKPEIGCGDNCLNRMVYTECSPANCPTKEKCRNQKIQRHEVAAGVERFMTADKGWGVRTKQPVVKGTYILEYVGEVVTEREFKERMASIYLNDNHHYCLHLDGGLVIDGHRMGSDCRFVNHSCQPNCEIQKWSVNGLSRMALFAKRNIEEGEELTYDYNFSLFNPSEGQPCRCNTPQCRGVIGGKSQRIKPLPIEAKFVAEVLPKENRANRQRKRKARKNTQRQTSKDVSAPTRMQPLTEKEKKIVKQYSVFLIRNVETIRRLRRKNKFQDAKCQTPTNVTSSMTTLANLSVPAPVMQRRSSTPAILAAQITALCTARSIKTRGLTLAVQDPEVEKMAKMAKILRDICTFLESVKNPENQQESLISLVLQSASPTGGGNRRKKSSMKITQKHQPLDLKIIQTNIEQGYYKFPAEFNDDIKKLFTEAKQNLNSDEESKLQMLACLEKAFEHEKYQQYDSLMEILNNEYLLKDFKKKDVSNECKKSSSSEITIDNADVNSNESSLSSVTQGAVNAATSNEDIISCICGLYKDEGLMIQCSRCMVWQHTECTKADVNAENYLCEKCEPREVDREVPLDEFTEEGHRYYLTLMRGKNLQVRQGDAVYVLRDIPIKDEVGNILPSKKHTYETIGEIDYNECDIFRVERLWKDEEGKRLIFGHHFLRPHETFHEPSRKFYPNEVVRVPLYEVVPIELVIGRCWVLDRTTFCKGRPIECTDEAHCFICELRVDKQARFFSKAKMNYPTCTKSYAFRKFQEKLRISKTYAPHEVNPALLKTKKPKTERDTGSSSSISSTIADKSTNGTRHTISNSASTARQEHNNKASQQRANTAAIRKRQTNKSPVTSLMALNREFAQATTMSIKQKRMHLEIVLKAIKQKCDVNRTSTANEPPLDLTYLLTGRGARQRKTLTSSLNSL
ncbi:histone-lysine N-methyltransferase ash1 [Glossina fuscipes]|uniref:Histone-lysine N-methyltransferase ash1 n=1 Tax=Glossina fuscipes TaxID=7396 RepID=A0A9C5ZQJ3_9MUSC|nr:histone-lysine N-methyltransferase ash1 [Glossina fuscipes]KAI9588335.1 hypothetical protein GQX74_004180 [Glossina fuscipes]